MIVAGFGFRGAASVASLSDAYAKAGGGAAVFATARDKASSPALVKLAMREGARIVGLDADNLTSQVTLTQSTTSRAARNTGSVAEAAALAAAGPGARLLAPRVVSSDRMATCALAQGDTP